MPKVRLEDILVCPACHSKVAQADRFLVCDNCGRRYPISENGIPQMLISEGDKHRVVRDQPREGSQSG